jgi:hypothetical protein
MSILERMPLGQQNKLGEQGLAFVVFASDF